MTGAVIKPTEERRSHPDMSRIDCTTYVPGNLTSTASIDGGARLPAATLDRTLRNPAGLAPTVDRHVSERNVREAAEILVLSKCGIVAVRAEEPEPNYTLAVEPRLPGMKDASGKVLAAVPGPLLQSPQLPSGSTK